MAQGEQVSIEVGATQSVRRLSGAVRAGQPEC
jgi:hypothetical protein